MSKLPDAVPCPEKPQLHLRGGYLCVVSPSDVAEACFSVPAVRALRTMRPQSTMAVLCPESQQPMWQLVTAQNLTISYPDGASARQIAAIIQACEVVFESAILWEAGDAAKAFARLNTVQRIGFPAKGLEKFLTDQVDRVVMPGPIEHRVRHYLTMVEKLGGESMLKHHFETPPLGAVPGVPRVALAPASAFGASYRMPLEKYVQVVEEMNKKIPNVEWVILGQRSDKETLRICAELAGLLGDCAKNYAPEWGMEETLNVLPHCSALLASDGETAHLAAHVGLPAVVVFGAGEPAWKRPLGKQSRVVREHVPCSPCFDAKCALDHRCMTQVSVDQLVENLLVALTERHSAS